jgi:hypothetical protein
MYTPPQLTTPTHPAFTYLFFPSIVFWHPRKINCEEQCLINISTHTIPYKSYTFIYNTNNVSIQWTKAFHNYIQWEKYMKNINYIHHPQRQHINQYSFYTYIKTSIWLQITSINNLAAWYSYPADTLHLLNIYFKVWHHLTFNI